MNLKLHSSQLLKPIYRSHNPSSTSTTTESIPLSVFDTITYDTYIPLIFALKPPNPPNESLQLGLQVALSEYREWAGRFHLGQNNRRVILLNDQGLRFVTASADCTLEDAQPFEPSALQSLSPSFEGAEELALVQLTRFACGTLVISFSWNHMVADGFFVCKFLNSWGQACRGVDMSPLPLRDRTIFVPRDPPRLDQFDHRSVEYASKIKEQTNPNRPPSKDQELGFCAALFTPEFIAQIKTKASSCSCTYSTFESVVAHIWRAATRARGVDSLETTKIRISVNGRSRLSEPRVPDEYSGNVVLWAFPRALVKDLLSKDLSYAAKLIHEAVAKVSNDYFKSFIDFASCKADDDEDLMPEAQRKMYVMSPDLEVDSWVRFPFDRVDFGAGKAHLFMPSFVPLEGLVYLDSSMDEDGGLNAYVCLFKQHLALFQRCCYSLD